MQLIFILSGSIVLAGIFLWLHHKLFCGGDNSSSTVSEAEIKSDKIVEVTEESNSECCGMHITCEKSSLSPVFFDETLYFDDEELDEYANRPEYQYTDEDIEKFRDVMLSLLPEEIAPWARSIQQRGITLPEEVRDELFIIVEDVRAMATA